jgi:hypothetical protein
VALSVLDLAGDRQAVIDSLPVPVLHFHVVPGSPSTSTWRCVYLNRLLGHPDCLQVKGLAFAN